MRLDCAAAVPCPPRRGTSVADTATWTRPASGPATDAAAGPPRGGYSCVTDATACSHPTLTACVVSRAELAATQRRAA